jgi:hypothetical protein
MVGEHTKLVIDGSHGVMPKLDKTIAEVLKA